MFNVSTATHGRIFQPWQPPVEKVDASSIPTADHQPGYIELPGVRDYSGLVAHDLFSEIQRCFLQDIEEMRQWVRPYVKDTYDKHITAFKQKLIQPAQGTADSLLPLYRDTRFHIHRLVRTLREELNNQDPNIKEHIALVLHDVLPSITSCPAGVHSRLAQSFLNLEAIRGGLCGKFFQARNDLYHRFIRSFLHELQWEKQITIAPEMEIHWFNALYNLCAHQLGLADIVDPLATTNLTKDHIQRFTSGARRAVTDSTVLRELSSGLAEQLSTALRKNGLQAWETENIPAHDLLVEHTSRLDSSFFNPVSLLLRPQPEKKENEEEQEGKVEEEEKVLTLSDLIEETTEGYYSFARFREKLLAKVASVISGSTGKVLTPIKSRADRPLCYIGTIDQLYFWVFEHDQRLTPDQPLAFTADQHTTLTLSHLTSVDFETWPETTCCALLTQAMEQTDNAEDIADFFLDERTHKQLSKIPEEVVKKLLNQLCDKLVRKAPAFEETLKQKVSDLCSKKPPLAPDSLDWLNNTLLLKPVLLELQQQKVDVTAITQSFTSSQIADYSSDELKKLLSRENCQRLFKQAFDHGEIKTLSRLLLTGHCDLFRNLVNARNEGLITLFARAGDLPGLQYLLRRDNQWINEQNGRRATPLHIAAEHGHSQCLETLLATPGIDVNPQTSAGSTPLIFASENGHQECVRLLVKTGGIDVNIKEYGSGMTPLALAIYQGHLQCVAWLLTSPFIAVNEKDTYSQTPLHIACLVGNSKCVRMLLSFPRIAVNEKDNKNQSSLHLAAYYGDSDCVKALLSNANIDVNIKADDGHTPLHYAAQNGHLQCLKLLLTYFDIDVNVKNDYGCTPLHNAVSTGNTDCVSLLLDSPYIDINQKSNDGMTALHCAARRASPDCVIILLNAQDIAINEKDNNGFTVLHHAIERNQSENVLHLLTRRIDVNAKSKDGRTALHLAALKGNAEMIRVLLRLPGTDINAKTSKGSTPLLIAAEAGRKNCIKALVSSPGIHVNEQDDKGRTALHYAVKNNDSANLRALLTAQDIDVNVKDNDSRTPMDGDCREDYKERIRAYAPGAVATSETMGAL